MSGYYEYVAEWLNTDAVLLRRFGTIHSDRHADGQT